MGVLRHAPCSLAYLTCRFRGLRSRNPSCFRGLCLTSCLLVLIVAVRSASQIFITKRLASPLAFLLICCTHESELDPRDFVVLAAFLTEFGFGVAANLLAQLVVRSFEFIVSFLIFSNLVHALLRQWRKCIYVLRFLRFAQCIQADCFRCEGFLCSQ